MSADSRCWELYYFPPVPLILQPGDMKAPPLPRLPAPRPHTPGLSPREGAAT